MSKKRISTDKHPASKPTTGAWLERSLKRHGFIGVSLSGGKSDRTCLAHVEYYPEHKKIFLSDIADRIKSEGDLSADLVLHEMISRSRVKTEVIGFNVPLTLPKCLRCRLKCPGYEACQEDEILWLWQHYRKHEAKNRKHKLFTPYTERCVERFVSDQFEDLRNADFQIQHSFGANMAPLLARAFFIRRRLKLKAIEVQPQLSLWRIGHALHIQKSYLRFHKHQIGGSDARMAILKEMVRREIAFLYEQDVRLMVENPNAFDAFICALTGVLKFRGQCEKRPRDFPSGAGWIEIPKENIVW